MVYRQIYLCTLAKATLTLSVPSSSRTIKKPTSLDWNRVLIELAFFLNVVEGFALVLVGFLLDTEHPVLHELSFGVFLVAFLTSALITTFALYPNYFQHSHLDVHRKRLSLRTKASLLCVAFITVFSLVYHYHSHHFVCTHDAFSAFSLCEYVIAFLYVTFHATAAWDFQGYEVVVQEEWIRSAVMEESGRRSSSASVTNGIKLTNGKIPANGITEDSNGNLTNGTKINQR